MNDDRFNNRYQCPACGEVPISGACPHGCDEKAWTVWVGGTEVNDHYLTKEEAQLLAIHYECDGYDDVVVEKVEAH